MPHLRGIFIQIMRFVLFELRRALLGGALLYFYPAAENFRIRIRRFTEKVFIVGAYGEKRGINSAESCREGYELVSAEVQFNRNGL